MTGAQGVRSGARRPHDGDGTPVPSPSHLSLGSGDLRHGDVTQIGHELPDDPAGRLIVATAMLESAALVTKDARIRRYSAVETIW